MSIGDKPVNAMTTREYKGTGELVTIVNSGLTYREWLIGMLASNSQIISKDIPLDESIEMILGSANAIIKQLDKEGE